MDTILPQAQGIQELLFFFFLQLFSTEESPHSLYIAGNEWLLAAGTTYTVLSGDHAFPELKLLILQKFEFQIVNFFPPKVTGLKEHCFRPEVL